MYMWLTHFTLPQKLAQRCEATVLQLNKAFIMCVCETESLRSTPETVATLLTGYILQYKFKSLKEKKITMQYLIREE